MVDGHYSEAEHCFIEDPPSPREQYEPLTTQPPDTKLAFEEQAENVFSLEKEIVDHGGTVPGWPVGLDPWEYESDVLLPLLERLKENE